MAYIAANGALPEGVKYLVYHCDLSICGGIGDRLFAISSLLYYAIATRRVFFIVHDRPFPLEYTFVPRLIDWRQPETLRQRDSTCTRASLTVRECVSNMFEARNCSSLWSTPVPCDSCSERDRTDPTGVWFKFKCALKTRTCDCVSKTTDELILGPTMDHFSGSDAYVNAFAKPDQLHAIEAASKATVIRAMVDTGIVADRLWTPEKAAGPRVHSFTHVFA